MLSSCPTDVLDEYAKQLKNRAVWLATEEQREYKVGSGLSGGLLQLAAKKRGGVCGVAARAMVVLLRIEGRSGATGYPWGGGRKNRRSHGLVRLAASCCPA